MDITREVAFYLYHIRMMTGEEIAKLYGVSRITAYRKFKKLGIKMRGKKLASKLSAPSGESHYSWKGGLSSSRKGGYLTHNTRDKRGQLAHRVIAEKALGRPLKTNEVVHHINGDVTDNRNANLLICTRGYHSWLHHEMKRRERKQRKGA